MLSLDLRRLTPMAEYGGCVSNRLITDEEQRVDENQRLVCLDNLATRLEERSDLYPFDELVVELDCRHEPVFAPMSRRHTHGLVGQRQNDSAVRFSIPVAMPLVDLQRVAATRPVSPLQKRANQP